MFSSTLWKTEKWREHFLFCHSLVSVLTSHWISMSRKMLSWYLKQCKACSNTVWFLLSIKLSREMPDTDRNTSSLIESWKVLRCDADTRSTDRKQKGLRWTFRGQKTVNDEKTMAAERSRVSPLQIIKVSQLLPGWDWDMMSSRLKLEISMQLTNLKRGDEESSRDSPRCLLQLFLSSSVRPRHWWCHFHADYSSHPDSKIC